MKPEDKPLVEQTDEELLVSLQKFLPEYGGVMITPALRVVAEMTTRALGRSAVQVSANSGQPPPQGRLVEERRNS